MSVVELSDLYVTYSTQLSYCCEKKAGATCLPETLGQKISSGSPVSKKIYVKSESESDVKNVNLLRVLQDCAGPQ